MKIEIYGKNDGSCYKCDEIKKTLQDKNVEFNFISDWDKVLEKASLYKTRKIPICIINDEHKSIEEINSIIIGL